MSDKFQAHLGPLDMPDPSIFSDTQNQVTWFKPAKMGSPKKVE
jgi:hypothetical protein